MAARALTDFERVLLAMICTAPRSGYELKQHFSTSQMGVYKPSSGSLYPALRRLEQRGFLRHQRARKASARPTRVYEPTAIGRAAHLEWVRAPLDPPSISPQLGMHLLRFVMMEPLLDRHEILAFLRSFEVAMAAFVERLEHTAESQVLGRHAVLALDHGIAVIAPASTGPDARSPTSTPSRVRPPTPTDRRIA